MLDRNRRPRGRLAAWGAFIGIGACALVAVNLLLTGGLDFAPGRAAHGEAQWNVFDRIAESVQPRARYRSIPRDESTPIDPAYAVTDEVLLGAPEGDPESDLAQSDIPDLQIDPMDPAEEPQAPDAPTDESVDAPVDEAPPDVAEDESSEDPSASESESLW
jgi:hypothetical protein